MPALPTTSALTGAATTEGQAKQWFSDLRDYLNGLLGADGSTATARATLGLAGTIGSSVVSTNTTLVAATHFGRVIRCTAGVTLTLPDAAAAGDGWWCYIQMAGTAPVTIARSGTSVIHAVGGTQGGNTSVVLPGDNYASPLWGARTCRIQCDGSNFHVIASDAVRGQAVFVANGTWICPLGLTRVLVSGSGGGGGAGGSSSGTDAQTAQSYTNPGGLGGHGGRRWRNMISVSPGTSYAVTIGAAGTVGASRTNGTNAVNGTAGGATSLGGLISLAGGGGGQGGLGGLNAAPASAGANGSSDALYAQPGGANAGGPGQPGHLIVEW